MPRTAAHRLLPWIVAGWVAASGCEPGAVERYAPSQTLRSTPSQTLQSIIDGTPAPTEDSVVVVLDFDGGGGLCTGAVIADRVVLTAKHCVQLPDADSPADPSSLLVGIGPELDPRGEHMRFVHVANVVTTPGSFGESGAEITAELLGVDIAVLTLQESAGVPALEMKLTSPEGDVGQAAIAIGYGQTLASSAGEKMRVDTVIEEVSDVSVTVLGTVCQGDSGGPLLNRDGEIIGLVSIGTGTGCGNGGPSYYQRIDIFADLILGAIERSGDCSDDGAEACDGFDNDCDGDIDEDCIEQGGACESDAECVTRLCADTGEGGRVCTARCDPLSPFVCPEGFVCAATASCEGLCVAGEIGAKSFGEPCADASECASLFCDDPGDGMKRCLVACRGGASSCLYDEVCVASDGQCGSCIGADAVDGGKRGQDEPCAGDDDCRSGLCFDDGGTVYCADTCSGDEDCDASHHCRNDACVRGARAGLGFGCRKDGDCGEGFFCAKTGRGQFCTTVCSDDGGCGSGFSCEEVSNGEACLPTKSVVGGACKGDEDCLSGSCFEAAHVCTRSCASPPECGPGLECVRSSLGSPGACLAPEVAKNAPLAGGSGAAQGADGEGEGGDSRGYFGCALTPGTRGRSLPAFLALLGLLASRRRRRR